MFMSFVVSVDEVTPISNLQDYNRRGTLTDLDSCFMWETQRQDTRERQKRGWGGVRLGVLGLRPTAIDLQCSLIFARLDEKISEFPSNANSANHGLMEVLSFHFCAF